MPNGTVVADARAAGESIILRYLMLSVIIIVRCCVSVLWMNLQTSIRDQRARICIKKSALNCRIL